MFPGFQQIKRTHIQTGITLAVAAIFSSLLLYGSRSFVSAEDRKPPLSFTDKVDLSLRALHETHQGKALLLLAEEALGDSREWVESGVLEPSDASRTDSTLVRSFDPTTQRETQTREVKISLDTRLPFHEFVLDLAHELTHASTSSPINPYDPNLTATQYIRKSIEAPGGEAEALQKECTVARELQLRFDAQIPSRCNRYPQGLSLEKERAEIIADFYRVGKESYSTLKRILPQNRISPEHPVLISSSGGSPYPESLLSEYRALTKAACRNSERRVEQKRATELDHELIRKRCGTSDSI